MEGWQQTVRLGCVKRFGRRQFEGIPFENGGEREEAQGTEKPRTPTSGAGRSWGSRKEDKKEVARSQGAEERRHPGMPAEGGAGARRSPRRQPPESPRTRWGRRGPDRGDARPKRSEGHPDGRNQRWQAGLVFFFIYVFLNSL